MTGKSCLSFSELPYFPFHFDLTFAEIQEYNNLIVIANNNRLLSLRFHASSSEFNHQAFLIDGFQEPKTHCQYLHQVMIYRIHTDSHDDIPSILSKNTNMSPNK